MHPLPHPFSPQYPSIWLQHQLSKQRGPGQQAASAQLLHGADCCYCCDYATSRLPLLSEQLRYQHRSLKPDARNPTAPYLSAFQLILSWFLSLPSSAHRVLLYVGRRSTMFGTASHHVWDCKPPCLGVRSSRAWQQPHVQLGMPKPGSQLQERLPVKQPDSKMPLCHCTA